MPSVEQSHPFSLRPPPAVRCTPTLLCPSLLNLLSHQPQGSSSQGVSGAMNMGSTGPGQSHSSTSPQKGLGGMPPGSSAHGLASPRKQQGQPEPGAASLRGPMLSGPPGSQMMGGGIGGGSEVVLPRLPLRGREDDYGGGRGMGPNGQAMEPLSKRPRCACVCVCWVCVYCMLWIVFCCVGFAEEAAAAVAVCCRAFCIGVMLSRRKAWVFGFSEEQSIESWRGMRYAATCSAYF